jgi:NAD(P)-dependent dehydrogenase (short-subunit alcohol dehydrogenase family)
MTRRAALITGGAIRLGRAIAVALAHAGYDIAVHYNSSAGPAEATAAEIRALGVNCRIYQHDLRDAAGLDRFVRRVATDFPQLSVLVNSASGYQSGRIAETSLDSFDSQFAVNLRAPFFLMQAFAAHVQRNGLTDANIINIADNKIGFNQFEYAAYLLTKKGLAELTRMAALEFAPEVRVNAVAPGVVLPAQSRSDEYIAWRVQAIPLQRQGETAHITGAILSLLDNQFVTGQVWVVDGGESIANAGRNATQFDPKKV